LTEDARPNFGEHPQSSSEARIVGKGLRLADRYRVDETIGRGGMAMVYRGYDELLHRDVAIKVLGPVAANATGSREEFLDEARAAAALSHENIVRIYDAGVHRNERYIVMEYVPGGSLFELIQAESPLSVARSIQLSTQMADALGYGHQHGIIHCDVKPQNVLLDEGGRPKLVDFGISRSIAATGALTDTITGTAGYIAPEQLLGERLDARVDIYALGCVTYEMLAGELPFQSDNLAALATQRLVRAPIPLRERNPRVPAAVAAAVMRAIERDPDQRYESANEFAQALRTAESGIAIAPPARARTQTANLTRRRPPPIPLDRPQTAQVRTETGPRMFWPVSLVVLGLLILAGAFAAIQLPSFVHGGGSSPTAVVVPGVTGQSLVQAADQLHQSGLAINPTFQDTTTAGTCTGQVLSQTPANSTQLHTGDTVTLVISRTDRC
jgi:eukaryotic-like serine/threonine-protein kinase